MHITKVQIANRIGDEGARMLSESLKNMPKYGNNIKGFEDPSKQEPRIIFFIIIIIIIDNLKGV